MKRAFFVPLISLFALACDEMEDVHSVATDDDGPYLELNLPDQFDYACLSSFEYDHFDLPKSKQCYNCTISGRDRDLIEEDYKPDRLFLAIRRGNDFDVQIIKIPEALRNSTEFALSYKNAAWEGNDTLPRREIFDGYSQCTDKQTDIARCLPGYSPPDHPKCLLMFPRSNP